MMRYWIIIMTLLGLMSSSIVLAEEKQYLLQEATYKPLMAAQELMEAERYQEAKRQLLALLQQTKTGSYDRAVVQQTLGYAYSALEQYRDALTYFQQALDSHALPNEVSHALRYNLGQLLIAEGRYQQGVTVLTAWLRAEPNPPNSARVLLANAYYQLEQYKSVVTQMNAAIKNERKVPESWYQLLLAAHIELRQYRSATTVVEKLIVIDSDNDNYWAQLSSLYSQREKHVSALAVQVLAQQLQQDNAKVIVRLSNMYRYLGIPYKSAELLQSAMDRGILGRTERHLNRLAESWLAARERAKAAAVYKRLAAIDKTGEADLKYARVLFDMEQWQSANEAFESSLTELKGRQRGTAVLLAGLSQFYLGKLDEATKLLEQATQYSRESQQAQYWLQYIKRINQATEDADQTVG